VGRTLLLYLLAASVGLVFLQALLRTDTIFDLVRHLLLILLSFSVLIYACDVIFVFLYAYDDTTVN
jgi:hypothetical protein